MPVPARGGTNPLAMQSLAATKGASASLLETPTKPPPVPAQIKCVRLGRLRPPWPQMQAATTTTSHAARTHLAGST